MSNHFEDLNRQVCQGAGGQTFQDTCSNVCHAAAEIQPQCDESDTTCLLKMYIVSRELERCMFKHTTNEALAPNKQANLNLRLTSGICTDMDGKAVELSERDCTHAPDYTWSNRGQLGFEPKYASASDDQLTESGGLYTPQDTWWK